MPITLCIPSLSREKSALIAKRRLAEVLCQAHPLGAAPSLHLDDPCSIYVDHVTCTMRAR